MWHNIGLEKLKTANTNTFTSNAGIRARRIFGPVWRFILRLAIRQKVHIEDPPPTEKKEAFIFAASHSCIKDVIVNMAYIGRSAYMLVGTTDQLDHNPEMYAAWLNGIIYVNRLDKHSRKESLEKMERILTAGTSIILFPEGGWNNTESLPVQQLFAGPWILAKRTGCKVVPTALRHEYKAKDIYLTFGKAIELDSMEKQAASDLLRDKLATLNWQLMEKYGTKLQRSSLSKEPRLDYMKERRLEYLQVKWTHDVWDEELTSYCDKNLPPSPKRVWESFSHIHITRKNAYILVPIIIWTAEERKCDFTQFMHDNWNEIPYKTETNE